MKPKNIKFPKQLLNLSKEYLEHRQETDPTYSFSQLVREAVEHYIRFWYKGEAIDLVFQFFDQKINDKEFQKLATRLGLRIIEHQIKHPEYDFKLSSIPGLGFDFENMNDLKKLEKIVKERLEHERKHKFG